MFDVWQETQQGGTLTLWILANALGLGVGFVAALQAGMLIDFGLMMAVEWPLMALGVWGSIPGPVEPIAFLVGGGSLAGLLQYRLLRRREILASKWFGLWIVGLLGSLPVTAVFFTLLGAPGGVPMSWPMETFLSGAIVGGGAALVSGKSLLEVLPGSA